MHRRFTALAIAALAVVGTASVACGDDGSPAATPPPPDVDAGLPTDTAVVPVTVTKPTDPQPVAADELPRQARAIAQMPRLSAEEKACANYAVKKTLQDDPSIGSVNGKLSGLLGSAIVACTTPARVTELLGSHLGPNGGPLDETKRACLQAMLEKDPQPAARLFSSLLIVNVAAVEDATKILTEKCRITVGD